MNILSNLTSRRHYERTNAWLNASGGPGDSVSTAVYLFSEELRKLHMHLHIDEEELVDKACAFTCRLYETRNSDVMFLYHRSTVNYPENWMQEHEALWKDYMHYTFDSSFWHKFWKPMREADWEQELPDWRMKIADMLCDYVDRDKQVLIRAKWMDPEPDQSDEWDH